MSAPGFFDDRLAAVLLASRVEMQAWFDAGMKRYHGRARLLRVIDYLTETVGL